MTVLHDEIGGMRANGIQPSTIVLWHLLTKVKPKKEKKNFDPNNQEKLSNMFHDKFKSMFMGSAFQPWTHLCVHRNIPLCYATLIEPPLYCLLTDTIAANFSKVYGRRFHNEQEPIVPPCPKDENHLWKYYDKGVWALAEFLFHGFQRPVDYLVNLLTEYALQSTFGMRIFTLGEDEEGSLRKEFNTLVAKKGSSLWKDFVKMIDLCCFNNAIKDVDSYHFPFVYEDPSPFPEFKRHFADLQHSVKFSRDSIKNFFPDQASAYYNKYKHESWHAQHLKRNGYSRFAFRVRQAVYNQILPVIGQYGMNPKLNRPVREDILNDIKS